MAQFIEKLLQIALLFGLFIVVLTALKAALSLAIRGNTASSDGEHTLISYNKLEHLFTPAERSFLRVLDQALDSRYRVFGKVRVADVLSPPGGLDRSTWQKAFNRIQSKHIDFVICSASDLRILALIELDDKSHQKSNRRERDNFLEQATRAANLPLIRIPCKRSYSIVEVSDILNQKLNPHEQPSVQTDEKRYMPFTDKN